MAIKVTFDSNVWRIVANPSRHQKEPRLSDFMIIRNKIESKEILPYISETIFTLEGIQRKNRKIFFGTYEAKFSIKEAFLGDGSTNLEFAIGPNLNAHPGNNDFLSNYLEEALKIGFRILKDLRVAMIVNPDLKREYFADYPNNDINAYVEKLGELDRKMRNKNCGMGHIESIGKKYVINERNWLEGLDNAGVDEDVPISKAIAEWADGDSVALHIANKNDFFFTNDKAKGGGSDSVFSYKNLSWLESGYDLGVNFFG
ncbi:MAG: hypothetical protein ACOC7U_09610 [Spirochaetota bacterium]